MSGNYAVAGIAGGSVSGGTISIENCMNLAAVTAASSDAAGIIGTNRNGYPYFNISNCANIGSVTATEYACAISAWSGGWAEVINCFNCGTVTNTAATNVDYCFIRGEYTTVEGCYTVKGTVTQQINGLTTEQNNDRFASGEIAYLLNQSVTDGTGTWYQQIGTDAYPALFGDSETSTVYFGYADCEATEKTYVNTEREAQGHSYTLQVTAPTCAAAGFTTHTCSYCNASYTDSPTPAAAHTYGAWASNDNGTHTRTCTAVAAGHADTVGCTYTDVVTPATCTEDGYTTHTCTVCGYSFADTPTQAGGHSFGKWHFDKNMLLAHTCESCSFTESLASGTLLVIGRLIGTLWSYFTGAIGLIFGSGK